MTELFLLIVYPFTLNCKLHAIDFHFCLPIVLTLVPSNHVFQGHPGRTRPHLISVLKDWKHFKRSYSAFCLPSKLGSTLKRKKMLFKKQIISIKSKPMQMLPYPGKQRESLKKLFPFVKMGEGGGFSLKSDLLRSG